MDQSGRSGPSSSPLPSAGNSDTRKPIKPPTVTPRRFRKFFTPLPPSKIQRNVRTSRRALQDITNPPPNQKDATRNSRFVDQTDDEGRDKILCLPSGSQENKRKLSFGAVESPLQSSPLKTDSFPAVPNQTDHWRSAGNDMCFRDPSFNQKQESDQNMEVDRGIDEAASQRDREQVVRRFYTMSMGCQILSTSISGRRRPARPRDDQTWQHETGRFYSSASDSYYCGSQTNGYPALPFCSSSCNSACSERMVPKKKKSADVW